MAHPDYIGSHVLAALVVAVAAVFLLLGFIAKELADQMPPTLTGSP